MNSIPTVSMAPKWKFAMAVLFGRRIEVREGQFTLIAYYWRGCLYVTDAGVIA